MSFLCVEGMGAGEGPHSLCTHVPRLRVQLATGPPSPCLGWLGLVVGKWQVRGYEPVCHGLGEGSPERHLLWLEGVCRGSGKVSQWGPSASGRGRALSEVREGAAFLTGAREAPPEKRRGS